MKAEVQLRHNGRDVVVEKRPVHQWRTDLVLKDGTREFTIGQLQGGETRRDVKTLAIAFLERQQR
jgi:hypothetical protein